MTASSPSGSFCFYCTNYKRQGEKSIGLTIFKITVLFQIVFIFSSTKIKISGIGKKEMRKEGEERERK
tara:strand:+ start:4 stop:207 length:204 start_codon:yes stop_codon:yes gene_type:complete